MATLHRLALVVFLLGFQATAFPDSSTSGPEVKGLDINGFNLEYVDVGKGEPIVFVHGAISDYRSWGAYEQTISESARYISYSLRHYGTQTWPEPAPVADDQVQHANDLATLIESLDTGPVHLVSWSNSGKTIAILGATRPELIKSITQYEPVVDNEIMDGIEEAVEPGKLFAAGWGPVDAALQEGDQQKAARLMIELVFEMQPGGFADIPAANQEIVLDNSRTIPLIFNDVTNGIYTCDYVGKTTAPTVVVVGENTNDYLQLMSKQVASCHTNGTLVTMADVNHNGPVADVNAFTKIILDHVDKNM